MKREQNKAEMPFGGHIDVLRRMVFRIITVTSAIGIGVFCFKEEVFRLIFAPSRSSFITYKLIQEETVI